MKMTRMTCGVLLATIAVLSIVVVAKYGLRPTTDRQADGTQHSGSGSFVVQRHGERFQQPTASTTPATLATTPASSQDLHTSLGSTPNGVVSSSNTVPAVRSPYPFNDVSAPLTGLESTVAQPPSDARKQDGKLVKVSYLPGLRDDTVKRVSVVERPASQYPLIRIEEVFAMRGGSSAMHAARGGAKISDEDLLGNPVSTREMVADHVIVRLHPNVSIDRLSSEAAKLGSKVLRVLPASGLVLVSFDGMDPLVFDRVLKGLADAGSVVQNVEPDDIAHVLDTFPNDPMFSALWGMHNVGQDAAGGGTLQVSRDGKIYTVNGMVYSSMTSEGGLTGDVIDCGLGQPGEFPGGASGYIALIERGDITFAVKALNAAAAGAAGVVVYNNAPGNFNGSLADFGTWLPVASISQEDGNDLKARLPAQATLTCRSLDDADIDAPAAWAFGTGNTGIVVAVIDTGVDYNHEDLSGNIWTNPGETGLDAQGRDKRTNGIDDDGNGYKDDWRGWDFANNDNDPLDDHGHGTHCAGTIGARGDNGIGVAGVCWRVSIVPIKALSSSGSGASSSLTEAIAYATRLRVRLTSNSWGGGPSSPTMQAEIDKAGKSNILFVAAAGNSGNDLAQYPASYPCSNIISVAATDSRDKLTSFSNYGQEITDLGAPGLGIVSCKSSGGYTIMSGTSMACPDVAGACALLLSQLPTLDTIKTKTMILGSVDRLDALKGKTVTGGRLNVGRAIRAAHEPTVVLLNTAIHDGASSETAGDGNGYASLGERVGLSPTLCNVSVFPVVGSVTVRMECADPNITVIRNQSDFGTLGAHESSTGRVDFLVQVGDTVPTPHAVRFDLIAEDQGGHVWTNSDVFTIYTLSRIRGFVTDAVDATPIEAAVVQYTGAQKGQVQTDSAGHYEIGVIDGLYELVFGKPGDYGYVWSPKQVVQTPPDVNLNVALERGGFSTVVFMENEGFWPRYLNDQGDMAGRLADGSPAALINSQLVGLGDATISPNAYVTGINSQGDVIGYFWVNGNKQLPVCWRRDGSRVLLPTLKANDNGGWPLGINNAGQIVGRLKTGRGMQNNDPETVGVLWETNGTMQVVRTDLSPLYIQREGGGSGVYNDDAAAINDIGQIVVRTWQQSVAYRWDAGEDTLIRSLRGTAEIIKPYAMNNAGWIVGFCKALPEGVNWYDVYQPDRAFMWQNGAITNLGVLPDPYNGTRAEAWAVNDHGQIVGGINNRKNSADYQGFLWEDGIMKSLDVLVAQVPQIDRRHFSNAFAINNGGQILTETITTIPGVVEYNRYLLTPNIWGNHRPTLKSQVIRTDEDTAVPLELRGEDEDGDPLTFTLMSGPWHGALEQTNPLVYRPATNFHGRDVMCFRVDDGHGNGAMAQVAVDVQAVNDAPVASNVNVVVVENGLGTIDLMATDVEGDAIAFRVIEAPTHGHLRGNAPHLEYVPTPDFNGTDLFRYVAGDGTSESLPTVVAITVIPINNAPIAIAKNVVVVAGTSAPIRLDAIDADGDTVSVSVTKNPAHGELTGVPPEITYVPASGYVGEDVFGFSASDGLTNGPEARVHITVSAAASNAAPTALFRAWWTQGNPPLRTFVDAGIANDYDGQIVAWEWNFGDGSTATAMITNHEYTTAGVYTVTLSVRDNQGAVGSTQTTVCVNTAPTVQLTTPTNNSMATAGGAVLLEADARDSDGRIARVEFFVDGEKVGEDRTAPYRAMWLKARKGRHTLTAVAVDNLDGRTVSDPVSVLVEAYDMVKVPDCYAYGLNNKGQVCGRTLSAKSFLWTEGVFTVYSNATAYGTALNDAGQASCYSSPNNFVWSGGSSIQTLAWEPNSSAGLVQTIDSFGGVGGSCDVKRGIDDWFPPAAACIWNPGAYGTPVDFRPMLPDGWYDYVQLVKGADASQIFDMNDAGQVVGFAGLRAFLVDRRTGSSKFLFPAMGSQAAAISQAGHVVGLVDRRQATTNENYFFWYQDNVTYLDFRPWDVNSRGQVVGYGAYGPADGLGHGKQVAILWQDGMKTVLNDLLPEGSGWAGIWPFRINEKGDIMGRGWYPAAGITNWMSQSFVMRPLVVTNVAPLVDAGEDKVGRIGEPILLNGTVIDDGLPTNGTLTISWSLANGSGPVTFADSAATNTTATFSEAGVYTLRLTASDGERERFDDVVVTVGLYHRISQSVGLHGSAMPCGLIGVPAGGSTSVVYTADPWFRIASLSNDGAAVLAAAGAPMYTNVFTAVTSDHNVQIDFAGVSAEQAGVPPHVPVEWAKQYYACEAAAAADPDLGTDYLLGLDPTNSYDIGFSILSLSVTGGMVSSTVQLKDGVQPLHTRINGVLKLRGAPDLMGEWADVESALISNALFDINGKCTVQFTDATNRFYKALIDP